jgi:hypothetical protein
MADEPLGDVFSRSRQPDHFVGKVADVPESGRILALD